MEQRVIAIINEEVDRIVNERLGQVLKHIADRYDIMLERLMKDVSELEFTSDRCLGLKGTGQRCTRFARFGGYCNIHKDQKPVPRPVPVAPDVEIRHTHTLPPLFLAGCPACEKTKANRMDI
jgi:hypothetical protein